MASTTRQTRPARRGAPTRRPAARPLPRTGAVIPREQIPPPSPRARVRKRARVRAHAWLLLTGAHICTRLLLAGARGCSGQIARASVYLRLLYQKGHVKSKRMDEFFRTFIRFYCGFGAAGESVKPRHARNGAKKEERAMCETAAHLAEPHQFKRRSKP